MCAALLAASASECRCLARLRPSSCRWALCMATTKVPRYTFAALRASCQPPHHSPMNSGHEGEAVHRHRTQLSFKRKWQAVHWPYRRWASSQAGSLPFRSPTVSVDPLQDQAPPSLASGAASSQPEQPAAAVELQSQLPAEPAAPGPAVPVLPLSSLPVGPRRTVPAGDPPCRTKGTKRCRLLPAGWQLHGSMWSCCAVSRALTSLPCLAQSMQLQQGP